MHMHTASHVLLLVGSHAMHQSCTPTITGRKLRCTGTGLSPNGLSFQPQGMVSLALLDKVLSVDPGTRQVTVQAGARVQDVADALRPLGLSLQNYASIREQTIGGFTQVHPVLVFAHVQMLSAFTWQSAHPCCV